MGQGKKIPKKSQKKIMEHITGGSKGPPKPSAGAIVRGVVVTKNSSLFNICVSLEQYLQMQCKITY